MNSSQLPHIWCSFNHKGHVPYIRMRQNPSKHKSHSLSECTSMYVWKWLRKNEDEWTRKTDTRKASFLAVNKACKAIFSIVGFKERTSISSGFSAKRTLISETVVLHHGTQQWNNRILWMKMGKKGKPSELEVLFICTCIVALQELSLSVWLVRLDLHHPSSSYSWNRYLTF